MKKPIVYVILRSIPSLEYENTEELKAVFSAENKAEEYVKKYREQDSSIKYEYEVLAYPLDEEEDLELKEGWKGYLEMNTGTLTDIRKIKKVTFPNCKRIGISKEELKSRLLNNYGYLRRDITLYSFIISLVSEEDLKELALEIKQMYEEVLKEELIN